MRQLVQLQERAEDFKKMNTELVFVFREESDGVDGLKKIAEKVRPANRKTFLLGLDPDKKSSAVYSSKKRTFDNYVIDSKGIVRGKVDGSLKDRATADELLKIIGEIEK
jgi:alkyl hydroperoxide reductase subunit AhpC